MAYGIPDYADPNTGGYAPQGQQRPQATNPMIGALMRGLITRGRQNTGSMLGDALKKAFAQPGGSGVKLTGEGVMPSGLESSTAIGSGQGIGDAASAASAGSKIASAPSIADQAAGNPNANFGAGGFLDDSGRAVDTGFGDTGLGGGLRASDSGPGLQQGDAGFGYDPNANAGGGEMTLNGEASGGADGGSYLGAATGALAGMNAGVQNYWNDPNMRNHKDGFGTNHPDYRAGIGGGTVGGVIGYYTNGLGNAAVPAIVQAIHPTMERVTRNAIMTGDKFGDSAGAYVMDPIGTVASGKYSDKQLVEDKIKYSLLGGLGKFV